MHRNLFRSIGFAFAISLWPLTAFAAATQSMIEAPGPHGPLGGIMLSPPSGSGPVILIIPGSGPTDHDGNSPLGIKAATYKLLAEGLAQQGIATVRIDKRGMFLSAGAVPDANTVTISDYAHDVRAWVDVIRQKANVKCVWLLGHSEGGLVALAAANDNNDGICGVLLIAAAGRPLGQILREQLATNPANAPVLNQASEAIDQLESGKHVDTENMNPVLLPLFPPQVQDYLIDVMRYDPAKLIAKLNKPALILQGQRDLQIGEADAALLKAANATAQLTLIPDANHVLKSVSSDNRAANLSTYTRTDLPLAQGIIDTIIEFVKASKM